MTVRLGEERLPNRSGGLRLLVRWLEEVAELLAVLNERLEIHLYIVHATWDTKTE